MTTQETTQDPTNVPAASAPFGVHQIQARVYYEDTDSGGIVYYANYLRFAERGRTEYMRACGLDHIQLLRDYGLLFAVRTASVDYRRPAHLDSLLTIETSLVALGGASVDMTQDIKDAETNTVLVSLKIRLVAISPKGEVIRLSPPLRAALSSLPKNLDNV